MNGVQPFHPAGLCALLVMLARCATYTGAATDLRIETLQSQPGWTLLSDVPLVRQRGSSDCGAAAMAMVLAHFGQAATLDQVIEASGEVAGHPLRAGQLRDLARARGLEAFLLSGRQSDLLSQLQKGRPIIVGLAKPTLGAPLSHYEVVVGYHAEQEMVVTLDPSRGLRGNRWKDFVREWEPTGRLALIVARSP